MKLFEKVSQGKLYIVGGSIRDIIIGRITHDIDLTTNIDKNKLLQIFTKLKLKHYLKHEKYGTVCIQ